MNTNTNIMKKSLKIFGTLILIFLAQNYYSQNKQTSKAVVENENNNDLKLYADNIVSNDKTKIITFSGNASLYSKSISFDSAEKMVYDTTANKIEIHKPKNFKVYQLKSMVKNSNSQNQDLVIYDVKENTITL